MHCMHSVLSANMLTEMETKLEINGRWIYLEAALSIGTVNKSKQISFIL